MAKKRKPTESQKMIEGTDSRIKECEDAGQKLLDSYDKREQCTERVRTCEGDMLDAMKGNNLSEYNINGFRFTRKHREEKVEVKKIPLSKTANR